MPEFELSTARLAAPIGPPPPAPDLPTPTPPSPPPASPPPEGDPPPSSPPMTEPGSPPPVGDPPMGAAALGRVHASRLRSIYRSAGWPCCDAIEIDLLAAGMLERVRSGLGHETLRLTDAGIAWVAGARAGHRTALSRHEALVEQVAREMTRAGRVAWRGLSLRARLAGAEGADGTPGKHRWCVARPDVFSIRNTSVEAYAQPIVHEVKVSRADLLSDLRKPDKRAAYLDLGGECWYVLGCDAKGRPIGEPDEIPTGCGVLVAREGRLEVARSAVHRALPRLPFSVWLALAKAQPVAGFDEESQDLLN
ncbi:MAG: hypothetical protein KKC79_11855 [Gammaproteobacteria bacterium]|nr:hypothetical protein [Gammaproteobacteria bacterium]MBU1439947.1 hypothetical protein [Gammaproteobacteria bacterium]MBU2409325.1 hypothetical protein [Gammaproteobacteria bacterium]